MRQAALLGNPDTKRTRYLRQAAVRAGLPVLFLDWKGWREQIPEGKLFLKIDPPLWEGCSLEKLDGLTEKYAGQLAELSRMGDGNQIEFLNHPTAIAELLDKRRCKETLLRAGLPATEQLNGEAGLQNGRLSAVELLEMMRKQRVNQVFIKPNKGSGAAGVSALRWHPASGRMALYTCALTHPVSGLVNTRRLRHFSKQEEIFPLLEELLKLDCIVERWYAKEEHQGFSYDLRAVAQDGRLDFLLARLSRGPITNLHLNNHPLNVADLGLSEAVFYSVTELCKRAMGCFTGLRSAGIDILLEKGSQKPRIIEMNAQGDLIYQDIYHENVIYQHQVEIMADWMRYAGV